MADWVHAAERAYVAAATSKSPMPPIVDRERALAAAGAIASHYLAVGTPRSLGLVVDAATIDAGSLSITAHRTWFAPADIRCAGSDLVGGARPTSLAEALACDIVCIHAPITLAPRALRRGTHVNVLTAMELPGELAQLATIVHEVPGLGELAAGFVDGRQLDEITVFIATAG